ncbi:hypothetical protein HNP47_000851 [Brevundimonas vesicularis]|uniref:Uncharacterized protein n=1 Tax=Brevundimonas vesicularis TaxID=41276 RepID=A0A7W9FSP3_BREVE|nr:hypothetical protein [Brevundimonas vesicularis]MBB5770882.1 hypothetical protein [Brevundimonas vesicularis]
MPKFDYSRPLATANRLFDRYGQRGAIRRTTPGTRPSYDPGPSTYSDDPTDMVVTDFSSREIDGTRILATDKKIMVAPGALTAPPALSDKVVEADGTVYNIVPPIQTKRPAGTTLVYILQGRR